MSTNNTVPTVIVDDVGGEAINENELVARWLKKHEAKTPTEKTTELERLYRDLFQSAKDTVVNEAKIDLLRRFLMILAQKNGDSIAISDVDLGNIEGRHRIERNETDDGWVVSYQPHGKLLLA